MMNEERERRRTVFYEEFPDGGFKFSSDQILKVPTAILAEKSPVFQKIFKDSPPDRVVEISDYDFATFKLFLDCLMDFQDYSVADTLLLFPIAWKYQTKIFIKKCLDILEPTELNENVCVTLNIALCCDCEELKESVMDFLKGERLIYRIFHEEKYYSVLELESVRELLEHIKIDSYIIQIVFKWGNCYLSKNNKPGDLKSFFLENGITDLIPVSSFETVEALLDFNDFELGKGFYNLSDVKDYFKHFGKTVDTRKCSWFEIKAGETLTEKIKVKDFALLSDYNISVQVCTNSVVFYEYSETTKSRIDYEYHLKIVDINEREIKTDVQRFCARLEQVLKTWTFCSWTVVNSNNCMSNFEFVIKRTFNYGCRILKRDPKNYDVIEPNPENLYFTDRVELKLRKK